MPTVSVSLTNREVLTASLALDALAAWLKPGVLSWRVGLMRNALAPFHKVAADAASALLDEHVELDEQGQRRIVESRAGRDFVWKDRMGYIARDAELMAQAVEIDMPARWRESDVDLLEKQMRTVGPNDTVPSVDFAALLPLTEPATPAPTPPVP